MQHLLLTAAAVASLFGSAIAAPTNCSGVETSSGTLVGHPSSNKTHVTEFLGIRYAEAPVGELRFAAPKKYEAPAGTVFEASEWVSNQKKSIPNAQANDYSLRTFKFHDARNMSNLDVVTAPPTSRPYPRSPTSRSHLAYVCGRTLLHRTTTQCQKIV